MLDEKNLDRTDAMGRQLGEMKEQVLPPPALEKAVIEGVPYGKPLGTRVHVIRITKAVAAYVVGIALFLGVLVMLPGLFEGKLPVGSDSEKGTSVLETPNEPVNEIAMPEASFYLTRQASPEEIGELFGQGYSPEMSRWFPVITIDSADALQAFYDKADEPLSLTLHSGATDAFSPAKVAEYDKSFFKKNYLVIGYFNTNSRFFGYALTMYSKARDTITFGVTNYGGLAESALAGNLMVVEIPRLGNSGVTTFGAYLSGWNTDIPVEDRKTVVEIQYGGTHRFSGAYAAKLTKDLAALDYVESEIANPEMYGAVKIQTANGAYTFLLTKNAVLHGDRIAKYAMGGILQQVLDHCPNVLVEDYIGGLTYLSEETEEIIAGFAEPVAEGMKPIVRIDSWEELKAFVAATDEEFRTAQDTAALDAYLANLTEEYGEDYFDGYSLLVSTFWASSGSFSYYLTDVHITPENALVMDVCQKAYLHFAPTCDMAPWSVAVRVPTELLADVVQYGRQ